jgi:hypothetical protein
MNWGHPSNVDTYHWNQIFHYNKPQYISNPGNEDTSIIRTVLSGSKVSGLEGFHCIEY